MRSADVVRPPATSPAQAGPSSGGGLVTVVVPARDERSTIGPCLDSVLAQDHRELQVVVVDNGSMDGTRDVVLAMAAADPRIELVERPVGSIPAALNAGLARARGDWFVRVDAHSTVPPWYVGALLRHFADGEPWGGVGGRKDAAVPADARGTARAIAAALGSRAGVGNSAYHYAEDPKIVDHVPFGVYPTLLLRALGGWNETLEANEDYELDYRIRRAGYRLLLDPSVRISWRSRDTLGGLFRQYRRYGAGKADVARLHPRSLAVRHLAAPGVVAAGIVAVVGGTVDRRSWLVLAPYGLAVMASSVSIARRAGSLRLAPRVASALVTMHVAWGTGFLSRLVGTRQRSLTQRQPTGVATS